MSSKNQNSDTKADISARPIKNLEELNQWKSIVNAAPQTLKLNAYNTLWTSTGRMIEANASTPQILYCHDMAGNYLPADVTDEITDVFPAFRFSRLHLIDIFVYFSHNLITIPPTSWINLAHRQGVRVYGTVIFESAKCPTFDSIFLHPEDVGVVVVANSHHYTTTTNQRRRVDNGDEAVIDDQSNIKSPIAFAEALDSIRRLVGFEGWLLNFEVKLDRNVVVEARQRILTFISHLKSLGSEVVWYDSLTWSGSCSYQNALTPCNAPFAYACNGLFTNYNWNAALLKQSQEFVKSSQESSRIFVGVDCFGRGCPGGGGLYTFRALEMIVEAVRHRPDRPLSLAIFAPGWAFEKCNPAKAAKQDPVKCFDQCATMDACFWSRLEPLLGELKGGSYRATLPSINSLIDPAGGVDAESEDLLLSTTCCTGQGWLTGSLDRLSDPVLTFDHSGSLLRRTPSFKPSTDWGWRSCMRLQQLMPTCQELAASHSAQNDIPPVLPTFQVCQALCSALRPQAGSCLLVNLLPRSNHQPSTSASFMELFTFASSSLISRFAELTLGISLGDHQLVTPSTNAKQNQAYDLAVHQLKLKAFIDYSPMAAQEGSGTMRGDLKHRQRRFIIEASHDRAEFPNHWTCLRFPLGQLPIDQHHKPGASNDDHHNNSRDNPCPCCGCQCCKQRFQLHRIGLTWVNPGSPSTAADSPNLKAFRDKLTRFGLRLLPSTNGGLNALSHRFLLRHSRRSLATSTNSIQPEPSSFGRAAAKLDIAVPLRPSRLRRGEGIGGGKAGRISQLRRNISALFAEERLELGWREACETRLYAERLIQEAVLASSDVDLNQLLELWLASGDTKSTDDASGSSEQVEEQAIVPLNSTYIVELSVFWLGSSDLVTKLFKVFVPRFRFYNRAYTALYRLQRPCHGLPESFADHDGLGVLELRDRQLRVLLNHRCRDASQRNCWIASDPSPPRRYQHSSISSSQPDVDESTNNQTPLADWNLLESMSAYDPTVVEHSSLCRDLWKRLEVSTPTQKVAHNLNHSPSNFTMLLPPPNVTGELHVGHALTCAIQDALARFPKSSSPLSLIPTPSYRMRGSTVLWIPGMDHAGIATQAVVERELGKRQNGGGDSSSTIRHLYSPDELKREAWFWKEDKASSIRNQLAALGLTLDWSREYFTLSDSHSKAVNEAFVRLYEAGFIYRSPSLVSWSCYFQSAIADIEVENLEIKSPTLLNVPDYSDPVEFGIVDFFDYQLENSSNNLPKSSSDRLTVATTRLETMLADTALAVHPEDDRYNRFIGRFVRHPFINDRWLPVIGDAKLVDPEKGTGIVKVSPGHSQADWECAQRHQLPVVSLLTDTGHLNEAGGEFQGLPRFEARQRLVDRLTQLGLYVERRPSTTSILLPMCSRRSGDVIEPMLRQQWFVRTSELAQAAIDAVDRGQLQLHPPYQASIWREWLSPTNHRDWCISRQLWWGHRIPAYRRIDKESTNSSSTDWIVALSEQEARQRLASQVDGSTETIPAGVELVQDPDVLDTWFSSALLPFASLGWPDKTPDLERFYPHQLLETGQDILFFWVARMTMLGLALTHQLPFNRVYLHGLVCDASGQKMSKSKGNVVNPMQLVNGLGSLNKTQVGPAIKVIGADSLRASLLSYVLSQPQVTFDPYTSLDMRRFGNKIWQTGRFLCQRLTQHPVSFDIHNLTVAWIAFFDASAGGIIDMNLTDQWLLARLATITKLINYSWSGIGQHHHDAEQSPVADEQQASGFHHGLSQLRLWWVEELCSIYLEVVKHRERRCVATTPSYDLLTLAVLTGLHLLHPIMPHLTEVVWQGLTNNKTSSSIETSLSLQSFPYSTMFARLDQSQPALLMMNRFEQLTRLCQSVNAWRGLLSSVKGPSSSQSPTSLTLLSCEPSEPGQGELELLSTLTRLDEATAIKHNLAFSSHTTVKPSSSSPIVVIELPLGSDREQFNWKLIVNTETSSLDRTICELERRLTSTRSKRDKLAASSLSESAAQKLDSMNNRVVSLTLQLQELKRAVG